jgi:hypothetical protein
LFLLISEQVQGLPTCILEYKTRTCTKKVVSIVVRVNRIKGIGSTIGPDSPSATICRHSWERTQCEVLQQGRSLDSPTLYVFPGVTLGTQ